MSNTEYKKIVLINQPAGLGDIFYLQKAVKSFADNSIQVYWPVQKDFEYVLHYLKHPNITYYSVDDDYPYKKHNLFSKKYRYSFLDHENKTEVYYIPFTHSHEEYELFSGKKKYSAMLSKYELIDMSNTNWQQYFVFERNYEREDNLRKKYKIEKDENFIFVNGLFASPPEMFDRNIKINTNLKVVYNDGEPCHIFDYCWIFENAKELHLVESAFCYMVEVLKTTDKLFMYSRKFPYGIQRSGNWSCDNPNGYQQHPNFDYINGIHKKPWVKIYD